MCLQILLMIPPEAKQRVGPRRLSHETGLHVSKIRVGGEQALHFAVTGGCSCEFLAGGQDFEGAVWTLDPVHLDERQSVRTSGTWRGFASGTALGDGVR